MLSCPFREPHLCAEPVNCEHADHLEMRYGSKDQKGRLLARAHRRPASQRPVDPGLVQGPRLPRAFLLLVAITAES